MRFDASRVRRLRQSVWIGLCVVTVIFLGLSVASAMNYSDIAYAKLAVEARTELTMSADGLDAMDNVQSATVLYFNATVSVTNPSERRILLQFLTYRTWIRNFYLEDQLGSNGSWMSHYTVLVRNYTFQGFSKAIQPHSTLTFHLNWSFSEVSNPATFTGFQKIINYTHSSRGLKWNETEWHHFYVYKMLITEVPNLYYGPNAGYLIELPVIHKEQGMNMELR